LEIRSMNDLGPRLIAKEGSSVRYHEIDDSPGYWIDSDGRLWSLRCLVASQSKSGHLRFSLRNFLGKLKSRWVHHLVLEAFAGPKPEGMLGLHRNDNPKDNRIDNLRYGTQADNIADAFRNGRIARGEEASGAKLNEEQVKEALRMRQMGKTQKEVGKFFGVHSSTISLLELGKTWR
jgi:hypothetical protein